MWRLITFVGGFKSKTQKAVITILLCSTFILVGCASKKHTVKLEIKSDKYYSLAFEKPTHVGVLPGTNYTTEAKYFLDALSNGFKLAGFTHIKIDPGSPPNLIRGTNMALLSLFRRDTSYSYTSSDMGLIPSGSTTTCSGSGPMINCNTQQKTTYGVVGRSQKTKNLVVHMAVLSIIDVTTRNEFFNSIAIMADSPCSDAKTFEHLSETLSRNIRFGGLFESTLDVTPYFSRGC